MSDELISREEAAKLAESWEDRDDVNPARWIASAIRALPAARPDYEAVARRAAEKIDDKVTWNIEAACYTFPELDDVTAIILEELKGVDQ